ncbi:3840_t:CDS:2 [Dentiscutata heterogama]|uniref:3840_t:CDS:1 n=1 Tax=Dentiscutata heterogama TaxID=1316150 RepID=A0ACA9MX55_9GLOM|nr:3840_t:CDS:2 [Dentiscutata heterogama]
MSSKNFCSENAQPRGKKRTCELIESGREKRTRASVICEGCKSSKRKCEGWDSSVDPPVDCENCRRKQIACKLPPHCKLCRKKLDIYFKSLEEDVKELKEDVKELKEDVKELKEDVKELKGDIKELKEKLEERNKKMVIFEEIQNQTAIQQFYSPENDRNSSYNFYSEPTSHEPNFINPQDYESIEPASHEPSFIDPQDYESIEPASHEPSFIDPQHYESIEPASHGSILIDHQHYAHGNIF